MAFSKTNPLIDISPVSKKDWFILLGIPLVLTAILSVVFLMVIPRRAVFVELVIKGKRLIVECAYTHQTRTQGLMYRRTLPEDSGMLFVYPDERPLEFWMKNTSIPLSIAFIKADGTIIAIKPMQPFSLERVSSPQQVMYALEMNFNWFERNQVKEGDKVEISEEIRNLPAEP